MILLTTTQGQATHEARCEVTALGGKIQRGSRSGHKEHIVCCCFCGGKNNWGIILQGRICHLHSCSLQCLLYSLLLMNRRDCWFPPTCVSSVDLHSPLTETVKVPFSVWPQRPNCPTTNHHRGGIPTRILPQTHNVHVKPCVCVCWVHYSYVTQQTMFGPHTPTLKRDEGHIIQKHIPLRN